MRNPNSARHAGGQRLNSFLFSAGGGSRLQPENEFACHGPPVRSGLTSFVEEFTGWVPPTLVTPLTRLDLDSWFRLYLPKTTSSPNPGSTLEPRLQSPIARPFLRYRPDFTADDIVLRSLSRPGAEPVEPHSQRFPRYRRRFIAGCVTLIPRDTQEDSA